MCIRDRFRTLIDYGVSDYIVGPVDADTLRSSIAKIYEGTDSDYNGRVIAFLGVSGGVGSSVLAHNTGNELANIYDDKAIVMDFDLHFGTAGLDFNLQPRQTIADALTQMGSLDAHMLDQFFMPFEQKVQILASPASMAVGMHVTQESFDNLMTCLLYTSPSPRDKRQSRMPSSA